MFNGVLLTGINISIAMTFFIAGRLWENQLSIFEPHTDTPDIQQDICDDDFEWWIKEGVSDE